MEPAHDEDLLSVYLAHTATLPGGEERLAYYDEGRPLFGEGPREVVRVNLEALDGI